MAEPDSSVTPLAPTSPSASSAAPGWPEFTGPGELRSGAMSTDFADLGSQVPVAQPLQTGAGTPFDVCHVGVVLRALFFVHGAVAVGLMFSATSVRDWVLLVAVGVSVALPAVLMWLVSACLLKGFLIQLTTAWQLATAIGLGALSGLFGWQLQVIGGMGGLGALSGVAPMTAGATLAAVMFYWMTLRAGARMPADTTARLAELQSRIRPHFLFNTLNTAIALARLDPARTEGLLEDLAELFRVALTQVGESVSLADEVVLARRYLAIEQLRFGDRMTVTWELDASAGSARVPPLLLQPLVENAVRHGVEPSAAGGVIRVRTRVKRAQVFISIVNTVSSPPTRPGHGIALRNVRERLMLLHDVAAQFETKLDRAVFRVQIVVPR